MHSRYNPPSPPRKKKQKKTTTKIKIKPPKNKNTGMSHHKYLKACVDFNKSERGAGY